MWIQVSTSHNLWEVARTVTDKQHQSFKLYLASLPPTAQDDNIQESMETFLSTVQEPFYLLRRSIQEFHNIRGASKNSIMTGSPLPSSSVITAHKHATRSEAMSNDSSRPMILKPCPRPVHGATKRKRRTGKSHLPPGTVRSFGDFWSTDNFFKKMTPSPSLL